MSVTRRKVEVTVASGELLDGGVGLISIVNFDDRCADETIAAIESLRQQGAEPLCYAYPFGQITEGADELLKDLGFRVSLSCSEMRSTVISGDPNSLFSLGRYNRDGRWSTEEFMKKLFG